MFLRSKSRDSRIHRLAELLRNYVKMEHTIGESECNSNQVQDIHRDSSILCAHDVVLQFKFAVPLVSKGGPRCAKNERVCKLAAKTVVTKLLSVLIELLFVHYINMS